jgi:hypothetical protein
MGQPHQLFVIAKTANRYRGLAVFQHQWLYGALALERCLRILTIFSAPENRLPIQQELTAASRIDEEFFTKPRFWEGFEVPFPFITTCLLLGASFDVKAGYNSHVHLQPFNMPFDMGDNIGGITVIDLTDLTHVRYCFMSRRDWRSGVEGKRGLRMIPLSGSMYLSACYNTKERSKDPKLQTELQTLEQQFDKWDVIDIASLVNSWPEDGWLTAETDTMADAGMQRMFPRNLDEVDAP